MPKKKILFVCKGNMFRSVIAECSLRNILSEIGLNDIDVFSRGLQWYSEGVPRYKNLTEYSEVFDQVKDTLENLSIDVSGHVAEKLVSDDVKKADVIIVMDRDLLNSGVNSCYGLFPESKNKTHLFTELDGYKGDVVDCGEKEHVQESSVTALYIDSVLRKKLDVLLSWMEI